MNEKSKLPNWYWAVCAVAIVWNLMGVMALVGQLTMTPEMLAQMTQAEQALYAATPLWVNVAFAFAVIGGELGCIGLLLRKSWAFYLFVLSLVGVIVQMSHLFIMDGSVDEFGPGGISMPIMIVLIAIALVWFAKRAESKGWIV